MSENQPLKDILTNISLYPYRSEFSFIDFFSGIGGFRLALESLGGACIGSSEIEKNAIEIYQKNWNDNENHLLGNIATIKNLPKFDLFVGGVPCQSWSIAGKNLGIEDPRGALWNDVIRLLKKSTPNAFLLENVKGLSDPRHSEALTYLVQSFEALEYNVYYKVLNSYDYGVPQSRERIYIVGIQKTKERESFKFPSSKVPKQPLYKIFDDIEKSKKNNEKNPFFILTDIRNGPTSVHSWDIIDTTEREKDICLVILQNRRKSKYGLKDGNPLSFGEIRVLVPTIKESDVYSLVDKKILEVFSNNKFDFKNRRQSSGINGVARIYLPHATFFPTITASGNRDFIATINIDGKDSEEYKKNFIRQILIPKKFRELKSKELAKVQGYPSDFILHDKLSTNIKLFGNSVSVPVIKELGKAIINTGCFSDESNRI